LRETYVGLIECEISFANQDLEGIPGLKQREAEEKEVGEWFQKTKEKTLSLIPAKGISESELYRLVEEAYPGQDSEVSSYRIRQYAEEFQQKGIVRRVKEGRAWMVYLIDGDRAAKADFSSTGKELAAPRDIKKWFEKVEHKTLEMIPVDGIFESDLVKQVRSFMNEEPPSLYRINEYLTEFEKAGKVRRVKDGRRQKVYRVVG
jgi:hypothetical protein